MKKAKEHANELVVSYSDAGMNNNSDIFKTKLSDVLFAMAQDIFDKNGARLENKDVAKKLKKMGKTEVEIIADPKYKYTLTAK